MDLRAQTATATGDLTRTPRRPMSIIDSERWLGPLLIGPAVVYIVLLVGLPFFMALYYSVSNTTTTATIWLTGGTSGEEYLVTNQITTAGGRIEQKSFKIIVREQ